MEPVPAPPGAGRARDEALQPRLRPDLRAARQGRVRLRGAELRGARHGEHGDPQRLRVGDGEARLPRPAAGGRDPLGVLDDRARRRLVRCDQHRAAHHQGRRPLRAQRAQVVLVRRPAQALHRVHRDGQDRPRRATPPAAVDDRRPQGHPRRVVRPYAARLRLRPLRRAPRAHLRGRARPGRQPARRGGRRVRHVAGPPRAGPDPPLHALDRGRRASPRPDGRPGAATHDVRDVGRPQGPDPGLDRRVAHRDRHVPRVRASAPPT